MKITQNLKFDREKFLSEKPEDYINLIYIANGSISK